MTKADISSFIHSLSVGKVDQAIRRKVIDLVAGTLKGKSAQEFFIENNLIQRVDFIYTFIYFSFRCILRSRAVMKKCLINIIKNHLGNICQPTELAQVVLVHCMCGTERLLVTEFRKYAADSNAVNQFIPGRDPL